MTTLRRLAGGLLLAGLPWACSDDAGDAPTAPDPVSQVQGVWALESASFSDGNVILIFEPPVMQLELTLRGNIVQQIFTFNDVTDTSFGAFSVRDSVITFFSFDQNINIAVYTESTMTIFTPPPLVQEVFGLENFHETDFLVRVGEAP